MYFMTKTINVGLIGFGMAGRVFHAPTITSVPGLQLSKIRETKEPNINIIGNRYPNAMVVNDSRVIFDDPQIDLVVIATPNTSHYSLAKEALLAGKNVVVDKPFTITTAEADELIALAGQQNKLLSVYQNRRFDSTTHTAKKIIDSGILGTLVECELRYDRFRNALRPNAWREEDLPGSGILYDLGAHLIDQAQYFFGRPQAITADVRVQRPGAKATDNFEVILHYPNLKVTLKAGMLVREKPPHILLLGDKGTYIKYGMDVQEEALKAGYSPKDIPNWGQEPEDLWGTINTDVNGLHIIGKIESEPGDYSAYYTNIYEVLTGSEKLLVTPETARNTIRIIELAIQSSEEKRTIEAFNSPGG